MGKATQLTPALCGALTEFEHHMQHAIARQAAFGALGPVADRCEGAFDRVRGSTYALPMLGGEVVEGQQLVADFDQTFGGFWVLGFERLHEQIEGGMCTERQSRLLHASSRQAGKPSCASERGHKPMSHYIPLLG